MVACNNRFNIWKPLFRFFLGLSLKLLPKEVFAKKFLLAAHDKLLSKLLLMLWFVAIEYLFVNGYFVVKILQLVPEFRVALFLHCDVDGVSNLLWLRPVIVVSPVVRIRLFLVLRNRAFDLLRLYLFNFTLFSFLLKYDIALHHLRIVTQYFNSFFVCIVSLRLLPSSGAGEGVMSFLHILCGFVEFGAAEPGLVLEKCSDERVIGPQT